MDRFFIKRTPLTKLLRLAEKEGLVQLYEDNDCTQILTLTPLSAELFHVKLDPFSRCWMDRDVHYPPMRKAIKYRREVDIYSWAEKHDVKPMEFHDPNAREAPEVLVVVEQIAWFDRAERRGDDPKRPRPPRVRKLLNIDRQWPIVGDCCQGRDLKYGEYCSWCDRSAEDHLIPSPGPIRDRVQNMRRMNH